MSKNKSSSREKNIKRIAICSACIFTYGAGIFTGCTSTKRQVMTLKIFLEESIDEQEELKKEINRLNDTELSILISYPLDDLIVADFHQMSEIKETYVLENCGFYYREIHGYFNAYYETDALRFNYPEEYYSFSEGTPLFQSMTEEELNKCAMNNGQISVQEIDKVLDRITEEKETPNAIYSYARRKN